MRLETGLTMVRNLGGNTGGPEWLPAGTMVWCGQMIVERDAPGIASYFRNCRR
jgi:hypothetical protein